MFKGLRKHYHRYQDFYDFTFGFTMILIVLHISNL